MSNVAQHSGNRSGDDRVRYRPTPWWSCLISALMALPTLAQASTVTIAWNANTEPNIGGYLVFFGTGSGNYEGYVDVGAATTAVMNAADSTRTYYFAVAAYSTSGLRSALSAEVSWKAGSPSLLNPGSQTSTVGQNVRLQLSATDPAGLALMYAAPGLPPGLSIANATGTISGNPSTVGAYAVTAIATNPAGGSATQLFTWTILSPPGSPTPIAANDSTAPTIRIASPTSLRSYTTTASTISLSGTLWDNVGVVSVTWKNDRGGQGTARVETSSWSTATIDLKNGPNLLTVTASDAARNSTSATLTVISKATGKK
jgi:putative Ig domain-containing protein/glucodextranase-like protein